MISHNIQRGQNQNGTTRINYIILFMCITVFLTSALFWIPSFLKERFFSYHFFQNEIIVLGFLLIGGYIGGEVANLVKFPAVTGYIIMGIFLGPSVFNFVPPQMIKEFKFIEVLGLTLVALIIGGDLHFDTLKRIGQTVVVITVMQAFGTFMVVTLSLKYILNLPIQTTLFLGAIASATAPAPSRNSTFPKSSTRTFGAAASKLLRCASNRQPQSACNSTDKVASRALETVTACSAGELIKTTSRLPVESGS